MATKYPLSTELLELSARLIRTVRRLDPSMPGVNVRLLSILDELGPTTVSQLAEVDRCTQPTMTGIVRGMVERGLVAKTPNPADSRSTLVTMTNEGRAVLTEHRQRYAEFVAGRARAAGRSAADIEAAVGLLADLVNGPTQTLENKKEA